REPSPSAAPPAMRHTYQPAPFEHVPTRLGYEAITGFDVQPEQTFGLELEITRLGFTPGVRPWDWTSIATSLLGALPAPHASKPCTKEDKDASLWNIEWDPSCGWELTSPVLSGVEGFFEVMDVCRSAQAEAKRLGLEVGVRTGAHLHLGWTPELTRL